MHDLPPELDALLSRARSAQAEPDARVRERVKQGVVAALATGAIVSSAAHASAHVAGKTWLAGSLAAKITGVTLLGAVAAGSIVAPDLLGELKAPVSAPWRKARKAEVPSLPTPAAYATRAASAAEEPAAASANAGPGVEPGSAPHADSELPAGAAPDDTAALLRLAAQRAPRAPWPTPPRGSLAAELRLLDKASQALAQRELSTVRALLAQHRASFEHPVMVEERDALELIARCQLDPQAARADAQKFLVRAAHSVLSARVARACRSKR